jgi:nuclear-control-of-ATPase protein 2
MPSQFIDHYTRPLSLSRPHSPLPSSPPRAPPAAVENAAKETLRSLLVTLSTPVSRSIIGDIINSLVELEHNSASSIAAVDAEEELLKRAVIGKLVVGLYAEALDTYLSQASEVESESEWWADIERSRQNVAWYLLQSTSFFAYSALNHSPHSLRCFAYGKFGTSYTSNCFSTRPQFGQRAGQLEAVSCDR